MWNSSFFRLYFSSNRCFSHAWSYSYRSLQLHFFPGFRHVVQLPVLARVDHALLLQRVGRDDDALVVPRLCVVGGLLLVSVTRLRRCSWCPRTGQLRRCSCTGRRRQHQHHRTRRDRTDRRQLPPAPGPEHRRQDPRASRTATS